MKYRKFEQEFYFERFGENEDWNRNINVWHYHNLIEIYLIESGSCSYFIDNKSYKLERGDIVLIPEGVIHNTEYHSEKHSRLLINCSNSYVPKAVLKFLPSMPHLYRNSELMEKMVWIFDMIEKEYDDKKAFSKELIRTYMHMLFFTLARNTDTSSKIEEGNEYIEPAVSYIQQEFTHELSLAEVAEVCSVSPEHFSRLFKKETGFGFCEYLTLLRLQKAEKLLKQESGLTISDIAYMCGFNDSNYFSVCFKKHYGISPKLFQKSINDKLM